MKTFPGLEGARGWLAWSVVAWHLVQLTGTDTIVGKTYVFGQMAAWAVEVFIVMSGFVITHLIISKQEPFGLYIARRALRLYPAYLVALAAGIISYPLWFETAATMDWLAPSRLALAQTLSVEYANRFWPHVAAHLSMFHGAIPNEVLPQSQFMFLGPAWSVSLEWQFYLVAPVVVWLLGRGWGVGVLLAATVIGIVVYNAGLLGSYMLPSTLPGAAHFFAFGIATRIGWSRLPQVQRYPIAAVILIALTFFLSQAFMPLIIWSALIAYTLVRTEAGKIDPVQRLAALALDSRLAKAAGARSYAVYILHVPIITFGVYVGRVILGQGYLGTAAVATAFATVGVLVISEITHRLIELPAINFGRRIGRAKSGTPGDLKAGAAPIKS